jgi:methyl-accepting chemotaxis protein
MLFSLQSGKNKLLLLILILHFSVALGWGLMDNHLHAVWPGALALAFSLLACYYKPNTLFSHSVIGVSLIVFSAIFIHLANGMIELHFHIFFVLALLSIYYEWKVIAIAAGATAVHHLLGLVSSFFTVYNDHPEWSTYLIHILFVALTSIVLGYQCEIGKRSLKTINRQNQNLQQAFENIEGKRQVGQSVSERIKLVTSGLNVSSNQQASGSQQQVSALSQVTSTLAELSHAAQSINSRIGQINELTAQAQASAAQVMTAIQSVEEAGEDGSRIVERTVINNQQVTERYDELVEVLAELKARSTDIKRVLTILRSISDETHLLALNAAIEAAGAGEFGERFGVVAHEIKALSNRSIKASGEVGDIIKELEAGIRQAVEAVEAGQEATGEALRMTQQSQEASDKITQAIWQSSIEVASIEYMLETLRNLSGEINLATSQQFSASQQAVEALQEIGSIARQTTSGSLQIKNTTTDLEQLSTDLQNALAA